MTSSSAGTAASHARPHQLHISTTTTTAAAPNHHHSPAGNAHSPAGGSLSFPRGGGGGTSGVGGSSGGAGSSTNQACAACKYQRRKCNPDCPLAPYFPADQRWRFLKAHRLFGVSNILKTLRRLRPELWAEAMSSLIFQAEMRAQDPVGGCYRLILNLERQYELERAELAAVLHHLALYRQAAGEIPPPPTQAQQQPDLDVTSSNHLLNADHQDVVVDAIYANHHQHQAEVLHQTADQDRPPLHDHQGHHSPHTQQQQQLFDYFYDYDTGAAGDDASSKPLGLDINVDAAMHQFDYDDDEDQKVDMALAAHEEVEQQQHLAEDVNHCHGGILDRNKEEYEMKAASLLVDVFDLRQAVDGVDDKYTVDVKANININEELNVNDVAQVDLNEELHEKDANNNNNDMIAATGGNAPHLAVESSQCRLGLAFSAL